VLGGAARRPPNRIVSGPRSSAFSLSVAKQAPKYAAPPQVAGSPELYPVLVDGPALPTLLGLLGHDNADLAAEVVDLLMELTDAGG
jgi:hypothetical protein